MSNSVVPCEIFSSDMFRRVEPPWCVSGGCALVLDGSIETKGILCVLLRILCLFLESSSLSGGRDHGLRGADLVLHSDSNSLETNTKYVKAHTEFP